ncbi:TPA: hypothetical protein DCZ31_04760 [Patescibacteria group bacterium]|nr:hypothetical protein [Candidatus Gracilibacteria bacterium]
MFLKLKETSNDILELSRDINFKNCIINCKNKKRYSCFLKRRLEIIQLLINNIYFKFINFYFKIKLSYLLYNKIVLSYIISFILIIFIVFYY